MVSDPVILLLDDERPQILSLRAQLRDIGELLEFSDPRPALDFLRTNKVDAAIVDIRMPRLPVDG
ncbi:MAG TPA: response regulator, partial [Opitutaceae bacterium]|nr:response regulator [Opitutaceae bacterium]